MPADVEGQRKQRSTEIQGRASKKERAAKQRKQKKDEKEAERDATKLAAQQKRDENKAVKEAMKKAGRGTKKPLRTDRTNMAGEASDGACDRELHL